MAKDRRSRDQKLRDKLAKRSRKARQSLSLAYMGGKYKTDELVPIWMQTEIGIYETFVITDRKLLDQTVVTALEKLIMRLRAGSLPPLTDTAEIHYEVGHEEDFVIENIRRRWELYFEDDGRPPQGQTDRRSPQDSRFHRKRAVSQPSLTELHAIYCRVLVEEVGCLGQTGFRRQATAA